MAMLPFVEEGNQELAEWLKRFKPKFSARLVVMYADGSEHYKTVPKDKVTLPAQLVVVTQEFARPIGQAKLSWEIFARPRGKAAAWRVVADLFLEEIPLGLYPQLNGEPSDFWEGDRVIAVGEGDEADIMLAEMPEDKTIVMSDLAFTACVPVDLRLLAVREADCQEIVE